VRRQVAGRTIHRLPEPRSATAARRSGIQARDQTAADTPRISPGHGCFALLMISLLIADTGFAVAAGVLLSAFIDAFLLPALTVLAGKAAWWPSHPKGPHTPGTKVTRPSSATANPAKPTS
jgi:hypothetical protein